jgi:pyrimidine operon attenuation protein/uracil phosphoribosyltransferase
MPTRDQNPAAVAVAAVWVSCHACRRARRCFFMRGGGVRVRMKAGLADGAKMDKALMRIAHQILDRKGAYAPLLIGIHTRGVPLSRRIAKNIRLLTGKDVGIGALDITLYRDDLSEIADTARINGTDVPFEVAGRDIVLVDDVIYTGRTAHAAMDAVIALGRPSSIRLAVLVDRGHRELPIRADYVGLNVPTSERELVSVCLLETDGRDGIWLCER